MTASTKWIRMTLASGVIAMTGLILSALALQDIYHGVEHDLSMEWNMVRASFLFTLMFIVLSTATVLKVRQKSGRAR